MCLAENAQLSEMSITPEMIDAAVDEFWTHDLEDGVRPALIASFKALLAVYAAQNCPTISSTLPAK